MTAALTVPRQSVAWQLSASLVLAVAAVLVTGTGPNVLPLLYLAAVTPELCACDLLRRRLPNRLVLPAYAVLLVAIVLAVVRSSQIPVTAVLSGVAYFGFMLVLSLLGGMGMGDVKLAGALGVAAGLLGLEAALVSPLLAFAGGGLAAVIAVLAVRTGGTVRIPFGPFMLAGFWAAVLLQR